MWERLKKYKKQIIIILVLCILGIPVTIHIMFKIDLGTEWMSSEWTAGEFLSYCGSILTFLGTMVLSMLALWQNQEFKSQNEKHIEYLEKKEYISNLPLFVARKELSQKDNSNLEFYIQNISENIANYIEVSNFRIERDSVVIWEDKKIIKCEVLYSKNKLNIQLNNLGLNSEDILYFQMISYDKYLYKHTYSGVIKLLQGKLAIAINEIKIPGGYTYE